MFAGRRAPWGFHSDRSRREKPAQTRYATGDKRPVGPVTGGAPFPGNPPSQETLLSSMVYHLDKITNPDVAPKPGTLEGVRRMEEILAFGARFFDNHHVEMRPGAVGKNLAAGLKSMNDSLRPLYGNFHIPTGYTNRICLGAAAFQRGGPGQGRGPCSGRT